MIRINRPTPAPTGLTRDGNRRRDEHVAEHAQGSTSFEFDRSIYGHRDVKHALRTAQHDKCCFCESKVTHVSPGDVEHFRPKAAFRRDTSSTLVSPGYFWLAYEWTNLLFSCDQCNRRHKGSLFPLVDERTRARSAQDDLTRETPLFVDPAREDPTQHIAFREEFPYAVNGSARGEATVRSLGLDRPELVERRRQHLQHIRSLRDSVRLMRTLKSKKAKALVRQIEIQLQHALSDGAEYCSATRYALAA